MPPAEPEIAHGFSSRTPSGVRPLPLTAILEATTDLVGVADAEGRTLYLNQAGRAMLQVPPSEDPIGTPIIQFHPPWAAEVVTQIGIPTAKRTGSWTGETAVRRRDGQEISVSQVILAHPATDSRAESFSTIIRDITDQKRVEAELRETAAALERQTVELTRSNADLEQFAYVASHDLQEPLRMVASYTQLLARRYRGKLDAEADEFIAFAVNGAVRMQDLINDLLSYSRVGRRGKSFEPTDANLVFDSVVDDLAIFIAEQNAVVTRDELPTVMADGAQLREVLLNLINNGIKFHGPALPRVHVTADSAGQEWVFTVRDNGIGIEPPYVERIFMIFQRLHSLADYPGTGIGLAICKKIIERHGGRIWPESSPGEGSAFHFTLPR